MPKDSNLHPFLIKAKIWLRDRNNLILCAILILALLVRLYYFYLTISQPLWWDEAEYASTGKYFAGQLSYTNLNLQRPLLFPAILALFYSVNVDPALIKFLLVLIPSFLLPFFIYLLGKEMYDEKVGLIAGLLTAVSWTLLFWTNRLQPDFISMCFQVLAILFMWKYWKHPTTKKIIFAGIFASLGYQFKVSGLLVPASFFVLILLKDRLSFIFKKDYWIFFGTFLVFLIPQFVYSKLAFGGFLAFIFKSGYDSPVTPNIRWQDFGFFYIMTDKLLFTLFIIGLVMSFSFLLYMDLLFKKKEKFLDPDIFSIICMSVVCAFYFFYLRTMVEDRWLLLWLPFIFFLASKPLLFIKRKLDQKSKYAWLITIILLLIVSYFQLTHADSLIKNKKDTYVQVEQAAEWLKQNYPKDTSILATSLPQLRYYSELRIFGTPNTNTTEQTSRFIKDNNITLVEVSLFEQTPEPMQQWILENSQNLSVAYAIFSDPEQTNPVLIVYEINPQPIVAE